MTTFHETDIPRLIPKNPQLKYLNKAQETVVLSLDLVIEIQDGHLSVAHIPIWIPAGCSSHAVFRLLPAGKTALGIVRDKGRGYLSNLKTRGSSIKLILSLQIAHTCNSDVV